ncbi:conserved hypothetical protein [uncultured Alphaproteobacteria bacterium]|uniref:YhdP central domain-containing protein n=1 Tax=uncultured Alphaproteobacteria bacterium TaxID=91750 RepID=A0A212JFV5_9PROT|nr:conserved hypothetical protein [uncultured Alphaproteobacteria bacterium]
MAFLLVFAPVLAATLIWQVRQGPVSLARALPYAAAIVHDRTGADVAAQNAFLVWDADRRRLVIRLTQVALGTPGGVSVRLPLVDLSYTLSGLARRELLPTAVAVHRPRLVLARDAAGNVRIGIGGEDSAAAPPQPDAAGFDLRAALAPLMAPGDDHLDSVAVIDAEATVIDIPRGRHYGVPRLNARLDRTAEGLAANVDLAAAVGGVTAMFVLDARYDEAEGEVRADLDFQEVVPSLFAKEFQSLEDLSGLAVPLSGRVSARLKPRDVRAVDADDLRRADAEIEIYGGQGIVLAPRPVGLAYPVHGFRIKGGYDGAAGRASLDNLLVELPDATISGDAEAAWPAAGTTDAGGITARVAVRVTDTAIDSFERYWPPSMVSDARAWVVENLRDGRVEEARFAAELAGPDWERVDVSTFSGEAQVKGASVHYLRPMPPITDVDGKVLFGLKEVEVLPDTGRVGNLAIQPGGRVVLSGLADDIQYADIEADIDGPVREALKLVDGEPLKLLSALGTVDPNGISGKGRTHLSMRFPLLNDLKLVDMTVKATSKITEGVVKDAIPGRTLTDGVLDLAVDLDGLSIKGAGKVNGVPMTLGWDEKFSGPGVRTRYTVAGTVDAAGREALGLDFMPFQAPYITGPMRADAVATVDAKGVMTLDAKVDLAPATMTVPGFGWRKDPGEPASGRATVRFLKGRMQEIPQFSATAPAGLVVSGSAKAAPSGGLSSLTLADVRFGESRLKGGMNFPADGSIDATLEAPFLNLEPLVHDGGWHELADDTEEEKAAKAEAKAKGRKPPPPPPSTPMILNLTAERARLSEDGTMTGLAATLQRGADGKWIGTVDGNLPQGKTVVVVQRKDAARTVDLASADAGALLRATGTTGSVRGGAMKLNALLPDDGPTTGKLRIDSFSVADAPVLAQLVSVASLTGIADLLRGQGVSFWYLDAPFTKDGDTLTLADTRAAGPSFGITTAGTVNTETDALGLKGTIVPFNLVNKVITNIPVIGQILGGKDSGLFAMNYAIKGTLDEPDVSVNPLSALVPGGVQKLFTVPDAPPPVQTAPPEGAAPQQRPAN